MQFYGLECQICGYSDARCLQFHHINGDGHSVSRRNEVVAKILKAREPLDDVMLLCANCHIIQDLKDGTSKRGSAIHRVLNEEDTNVL